jgi:2-polyprenyl-3-methyl-5-hydroxy-6-metoxy-1,4-benzoquinol methylase
VMHDPAVRDVMGSVGGLRIADLGCGDGRLAQWMIAGGCASYLGIDASAGMLAAARRELPGSSAEFVQSTIEQIELAEEYYDLVVSFLALHYLETVDGVFERCCGALVRGGRLVISVPHPVLTAPRDVLADAGLSLISLCECPPVRSSFEGDGAEIARRMRVPAFLVLEARRAD